MKLSALICPPVLGDIIISVDKAREQAEEYGHSLMRELGFLTVHGFLHLLGYDHMTEEEEKEMFTKQKEILNDMGSQDPHKQNEWRLSENEFLKRLYRNYETFISERNFRIHQSRHPRDRLRLFLQADANRMDRHLDPDRRNARLGAK